jgi:protein-disulfide isomerase
MSNNLTSFSVITALGLIATLVSIQIGTLSNFQSNTLAMGAETGTETAEERAQEENTNQQNGFSPGSPPLNVTEPAGKITKNLSLLSLREEGSPIIGNTSAPITVVEFGDFQCHFCGRFARATEPQINQTYIQTGKINLVFKHFVTHGPDSMSAAIASQCANEQGGFWKFYELLYGNQGEENSGWASVDNLKKFASQIPGMNTSKFNSCLDNQKYKSIVDNDTAFAYKSGFQGTPTFIVEKSDGSDPQVLLGAYPFPVFQAILDKKISGG